MIKNYENFLNEGKIKDTITSIFKYFKGKFGKKSWMHYLKHLIENNEISGSGNGLPVARIGSFNESFGDKSSKVDIFIPDGYFDRMSSGDVKSLTEDDILSEIRNRTKNEPDKLDYGKIRESNQGGDFLNDDDDVVTLSYPVEPGRMGEDGRTISEVVRNISAAELKDRVRRIYKKNVLRDIRHEAEGYSQDSKFKRIKTNALFIWGAPGVGKTSILKQLGEEFDMPVFEFHLAQMEATDMIGLPEIEIVKDEVTGKKHRATVYRLPDIFPEDNGNGNGGILFFDELNRANQLVLSAALPLTLNGKVENYTLPSKWIIVAAGNRPSDLPATAQSKLKNDPILWNRFSHVNYSPTVEDFEIYSKDREWISPYLVDFLKKNPNFYHRFKPNDPNPVNPTPRKWEDASADEFATLRNRDWSTKVDLEKLRRLYEKHVGKTAANKYTEYIKLSQYISDDILNAIYDGTIDNKNWKFPKKVEIEYALMLSISYFKQPKGKITPEEYQNVINYIFDNFKGEKMTRFFVAFFRAQDGGDNLGSPAFNPKCQKIKSDTLIKWHKLKDIL